MFDLCALLQLLSKVRWGKCTPDVLAELRGCSVTNSAVLGEMGSQGVGDGIEKTQLLTHKADVLRVNEEVGWLVRRSVGRSFDRVLFLLMVQGLSDRCWHFGS